MSRFRRSRGAVAAFDGSGKKNLQRLNPGLRLREQFSIYQVEGEIGRFRFRLYEAVDADGGVVSQGSGYFPARGPREWHKTEGFREEALCLEASQRSYRTNAAHTRSATFGFRQSPSHRMLKVHAPSAD